MACKEWVELIGAHLDGELSADEARKLEEHLRQCAECRREYELQKRLWSSLGRWEVCATRVGLEDKILSRTTRAKRSTGRQVIKWLAPVAAAATVLLAVGVWMMTRSEEPALAEADVAVVENLDLLEKLDVLLEYEGLAAAAEEPGIIEHPEALNALKPEDAS